MLHHEGFTMVYVHCGVRAKTMGQTCTCVTHTRAPEHPLLCKSPPPRLIWHHC
jgi:hypothetical protein